MFKVITTRGILPVTDVVIGDTVYEYGTGNPIEVRSIDTVTFDSGVKITFSDGREDVYGCCEYIPVGVYKHAKDIPEDGIEGAFFLYEVEFDRKRITEPLYPDPYVAGALLMYGDYNDPYLNLPSGRYEVNNNLSHTYNIEYFPTIGTGKLYFQWKGKDTDHRITWDEFFPGYNFFAKTHCIASTPIPLEYMFAWKKDRVQFIRGAFDIGYRKDLTPDQVSVNHWSKERLEWLQWMIWSMGIPCELKEYPEYDNDKIKYQLNVLDYAARYPGFFYWSYLEQQIVKNYMYPSLEHRRTFGIVKTEKIEGPIQIPRLVFDKPTIYYTSQFLPRCSE